MRLSMKTFLAGIGYLLTALNLLTPTTGIAQQNSIADDACMKLLEGALDKLGEADTSAMEFIGLSDYNETFSRIKQIQEAIPEKVFLSDSLISFKAGQKQLRFEITGLEWYGYSGYLSDLRLHLMVHSSASSGIATSFFVNDLNGEVYQVPSQIDQGFVMAPRTSGSQEVIFYGVSDFSSESIITVYHIVKDKKGYCLHPVASNVFPNTRISEIADTGEGYAIVFSERQSPENITEPLFFEYFKLIWPSSTTSRQKKQ
jgi:hypothetical protein